MVTGGARGIGRAVATRLAGAGAQVEIWDRDAEAAAEAANGLRGAIATTVDVTRAGLDRGRAGCGRERGPDVDVLVNNAGIAGRGRPATDLTDADWDEIVLTDPTSVFYCCRAVLP